VTDSSPQITRLAVFKGIFMGISYGAAVSIALVYFGFSAPSLFLAAIILFLAVSFEEKHGFFNLIHAKIYGVPMYD